MDQKNHRDEANREARARSQQWFQHIVKAKWKFKLTYVGPKSVNRWRVYELSKTNTTKGLICEKKRKKCAIIQFNHPIYLEGCLVKEDNKWYTKVIFLLEQHSTWRYGPLL